MITSAELTRVAIALLALLVAHAGGALFQRFKQPRVIGEILGGLVLGPTVLGQIWPDAVAWMFTDNLTVRAVIGFVQQLGPVPVDVLRRGGRASPDARHGATGRRRGERSSVSSSRSPRPAGRRRFPMDSLWGENANQTSFVLVFATAVAVTSIPVISRIMHDLGLLRTGFARVVLGVAVVEDVILYVILAVAVDLATPDGPATGLPGGCSASRRVRRRTSSTTR